MARLRTIALIVSVALHIGAGAGLVLVSESRIEQGGGDTPMEVSLDPSAASGGNGPPIDAGPSGPPPQVAESPPQEMPPATEPPPEITPPAEEKPPEETPKEEQAAKPDAAPPPRESKETPPPTESEPPPPVIKSSPESDTPEVVASEPPPPKPVPPPPKPPPPKPVPPKPVPPKPPPPQATSAGAAGGAAATGRVRTQNVGSAVERGAEQTCAAGVRSRLRHPLGSSPRPFRVEITVARSGALIGARLSSSSGSPAADQAALRAVRSSGPFPPCPGIAGAITIGIPFR